ncbi:tetratricopeptide repeat protein [Buttiauxella sp. B2]|uniref:NfrA family protein n=1 Tax=Buttiauxella sp. B2 TaxID=2587812 RepID=UPI00112172B6|nr:tetratricopeptide repeat protein [Buttiauxella sp. B2]TNV22589.1 tetratricopeptide repeat protein [Buttiauxella sp. B2]
MNRRMAPLAALICGVLVATPAQAAEEGSKQDLGLNDYRYFKVYPHIERAQKAMKANDEVRALSSFEHAHEMAPESVRLTLWLAEAYRHFGYNQKAQALLENALKNKPQNPDLQRALEVIPVPAPEIKTVEQLRALQQHCDAAPTIRCRSEVGNYALKLKQLEIARAQLSDAQFRHSKEGRQLADNYTQRAIFLQQWTAADQGFALLDGEATLSEAQYQQWFAILLHMQRDQRILDLQSQGVMNSAGMQLAYAQSLAERNALTPLRRYLASHKPVFDTPAEERNWLRLLATYSQTPGSAVAGWAVKYQENKKYFLTTLVPISIQKGDWQGANDLLNTFPGTQALDQRLALSLARKDTQSIMQLTNVINKTRGLSPRELETVSYQLVLQGQKKMATELLLHYWPFNQAGQFQHSLSTRLYTQLNEHPEWLADESKARMAKPLPTASQRMAQARLFQGPENCTIVRNLLGDLSSQYDAESWSHLAQCYPGQPGLALYAAQQAVTRSASPYYQRQVAYLAYAAEDYKLAQASWAQVPVAEMVDDDVQAAARGAKILGDDKAFAYWQNLAWQRGMPDLKLDSVTAQDDASRGFALLAQGKYRESRDALEKARAAYYPHSPEITRQLVYLNERLDDKPKTREYSERVVDDIDNTLTPHQKLSDKQKEDRFEFRRIHEDSERRWTFTYDGSFGLTPNSLNSAGGGNGVQQNKSYRSYEQVEAEYRIGKNQIIDGDQLSVYSRIFAGSESDGNSNFMPVYEPMLGVGVRWKPLRNQVIYLAAEQQIPLGHHDGKSDVMLRASASFFNDGKYSDDWHPTGKGWMAQNLYLDAAHFVKADYQLYTADYRMSWHQKTSQHQTIEPYWHAQYNVSTDSPYRDNTLGGVGVRFNTWFGETHYNAYPHKVSVGLEYQHAFSGHNRDMDSRNSLFLTLGARW